MHSPDPSDPDTPLPVRPKAIAFDMDGTLLDHDGRLDDAVAQGVRRLADAGVKVFLVSGRLQSGCLRFWEQLGLDTPIAACNGATVGLPGQPPFVDHRLSAKTRDIVLDIDQKHGLHIHYCVENTVYTLHDGPVREDYSRKFSPVQLAPGPEAVLALPIPSKCLCIIPESEQPRCLDLFARALDGAAAVTTSSKRFIEIIPTRANKGYGLEELARWSGIPVERFAAAGDAMNDAPMLKAAGFAVGFTSGDPRLAEFLDATLPPLWEGGMEILLGRILGPDTPDRLFGK